MSNDYLDKYDVAGDASAGLLGKAKDFSIATAADFVGTLYNSTAGLLPGVDDLRTEDILKKVDNNSLAFYQEHTDGVQSASFIAGAVGGGLAAVKLLGRAKAGIAALNKGGLVADVFSGKKVEMYQTDLRAMMESGRANTTQYRDTMIRMYGSRIGETFIDSVILEGITVATLNAHPYMEDYMQSPYSSFAMWAALGGAIGSVAGAIGVNQAVRSALGEVQSNTIREVTGAVKYVDQSLTSGDRFQRHSVNIANLESLLQDEVQNQATRNLTIQAIDDQKFGKETAFSNAASWIEKLPEKDRPAMKDMVEGILADPRFIKVDKVRLPSLLGLTKESKGALPFDETTTLLLKDDEGKSTIAFYRPSSGELFDRSGARSASLAVDIKGFKVAPKEVAFGKANNDFIIEAMSRLVPSAKIDASYLNELAAWSKMESKNLASTTIAPNDLARQNAAVRWAASLKNEDRFNAKFFIRSESASYNDMTSFIEKGGAGVKPTHIQDLDRLIHPYEYGLIERLGTDSKEGRMLARWKGGDTSTLRRAFDSFFRGTSLPANEAGNAAIAQKIWKEGASVRADFAKHADADGNVRLYKGLRNEVQGHAPLEGYTVDYKTAKDFAHTKDTIYMFKVPVANIVGKMGGRGHIGEKEILVTSPHHEISSIGQKAVDTAEVTKVNVPASVGNKDIMTAEQLVEFYHSNVEDAVKQMQSGNTMSFEEIAAKLNLTKEAAIAIGANTPISELIAPFRYTDANKIVSDYLHPSRKMVMVSGNPRALDRSLTLANQDNRDLDVAHQLAVQFFTAQSPSSFAKQFMEFFHPTSDSASARDMMMHLQLLKQDIGDVNNLVIGKPTFQTLDNNLRRLKEGRFVTFVGKFVSKLADSILDKHLTPISQAFGALRNSETGIIEAEVLRNKLLSLSDWRDIRVEEDTGLGYIVQREKRGADIVEVPVREKDGSIYYIRQPEVVAAFESQRELGRELYNLHNLHRKILGQVPLKDLGYYIPPPSLVGKFISRVIDVTGAEKVKLLYANSAEELAGLESAYKSEVIATNPQYRIVTGTGKELSQFNVINSYNDGEMFVTSANNELKHSGASASAINKPDARGLNEMIDGWTHQVNSGVRKFGVLYLDDVMQKLDFLSSVNQKFHEGQAFTGIFKQKAPDAAMLVKNALLGVGNLNQNIIFKTGDNIYSMLVQRASDIFSNTTRSFFGKVGSEEHFNKLVADTTEVGMKPPWESYLLYSQAAQATSSSNVSKRVNSAAIGLMSNFQLRLGDAAFAAVNALSLPILLHASLKEMLPKTVLGNGASILLPMRIMYDAVRFRFNPVGKDILAKLAEQGFGSSETRAYADLLGKIHSPLLSKDATDAALSAIESFQNSKAVKLLSTPADFVEKLTQDIALLTGYLAAKHAYPGISDAGARIHAVSMSDRAIGNYHPGQRAVMFQGTLGSMLGLYQTYMMSFAQSVYRNIENKQFMALTQTALLQTGLFGAASWPGYNLLSEFIGKHMSNQNYDLTTGTYRALDNPTAELVLYGMPSMMGPALYTRGDVSPRLPTMDNLAIVNSITGIYNTLGRMTTGLATQPGLGGKLQSFEEALSLQSMSRPIARLSELAMGESITTKGQTVANSDEVWTPMGIFSRLISARPMQEQVTRNVLHLNTYYGATDYAARQEAVTKLRTAIRSGTGVPDDLLDSVAETYLLKGGSSAGWNDVMNTIMLRTEEGTRMDLMRKLEPTSPLRRMIQENF